jgi:hypothetical protein
MVEAGMADAVPVEPPRCKGAGATYDRSCHRDHPRIPARWDAALMAARFWHESQAKKALIQARRSRFPKNFEREAEVHQRPAEMITTLSPDDV